MRAISTYFIRRFIDVNAHVCINYVTPAKKLKTEKAKCYSRLLTWLTFLRLRDIPRSRYVTAYVTAEKLLQPGDDVFEPFEKTS